MAVRPGETLEALRRGAAVVVSSVRPPAMLPASLTWVLVPNPEAIVGLLAGRFWDSPTTTLDVFAVTGTNGKTTVSTLLHQLFRTAGLKAALVGTVDVRIGDVARPARYTTPPAWLLQELFAEARRNACSHVALEATSHALSTKASGYRLVGTRVAVGGFTNLTRDHLDFHQSMEDYRGAKARLFSEYAERACFNIDDEFWAELAGRFAGPKLTVSQRDPSADLFVRSARFALDGTDAVVTCRGEAIELRTSLIGRHNLENAIVALGMAQLGGLGLEASVQALARATPPTGRLTRVSECPGIFVDYAHTPDGLENVLNALRPLGRGRLICVFGAGGDRDRGKRPQMGEVATRLADVCIVTSDNPRSEDPRHIIDNIVRGMPATARYEVHMDRQLAIERAVVLAGAQDIVLVAGKGHETYQIVGDTPVPFNDFEVAASAVAART